MDKEVLKLGGILGAISLCVALLLAVANFATKDIIANRAAADEEAALKVVMEQADEFKEIKTDKGVVFEALNGGEKIGYCVKTSSAGYGGEITMVIGVADGKVTGVSITGMNETPGLGAKAEKPEFTNQYKGASGSVALDKNGGDIAAISGATITSKAVTEGVNTALAVAAELEGGAEDGE